MAGAYSLACSARSWAFPSPLAGWAVAVERSGRARPCSRVEHIGAAAGARHRPSQPGFTGLHVGQHVTIDRDPGSYSTTARWIARDGSLTVDAAAALRRSVRPDLSVRRGLRHGRRPARVPVQPRRQRGDGTRVRRRRPAPALPAPCAGGRRGVAPRLRGRSGDGRSGLAGTRGDRQASRPACRSGSSAEVPTRSRSPCSCSGRASRVDRCFGASDDRGGRTGGRAHRRDRDDQGGRHRLPRFPSSSPRGGCGWAIAGGRRRCSSSPPRCRRS